MKRLAWLLCMCAAPAFAAEEVAGPWHLDAIKDSGTTETVGAGARGAAVLRAQILLDRAHFSPGEIDGRYGANMRAAIAGFQKSRGLKQTGNVDEKTWQELNRDREDVLDTYRIADEDVAGPFQAIPQDMMDKAKLPALDYSSPEEALGERFHIKPALLAELNPDKDLRKAGENIVVPVVDNAAPAGAARVVVDKSQSTVALVDESGKLIAQYPATIGSKHDPLPLGKWTIKGVGRNPTFKYNPDLFWDADNKDSKAMLPAGPNNPVGVVWIDLSKPHYGIHGTPEPGTIRRSESHGCIRMTNWSALAVADAVKPGMPAILQP